MLSSQTPSSVLTIDTEITSANINDDNWCCIVVMLVESDPQLTSLVDLFEKSALTHKEYPIRIIKPKDLKCKEVKLPKGGSLRQTRYSKSALPETPAKILKKIILKQKYYDLEERKLKILHLKSEAPKENVQSKVIGDNSFIQKKDLIKSSTARENVMRKKGNDCPSCGPFCYFVLTKFYDSSFPQELLQEGIPLVAVFELMTDTLLVKNASTQEKSHATTPTKTQGIQVLIKKFWTEFIYDFANPSNCEVFSDTLLLPINTSKIRNWFHTEDNKSKSELLFDYIKKNLFSLTMHLKNYLHYINNMELLEVPTISHNIKPKLDKYETMLNGIPLECVTVELVLFGLIEQVVQNEESCRVSKSSNLNTTKNSSPDVTLKEPENQCETIFIHHRDRLQKKFVHCSIPYLNLKDIHIGLYKKMPYVKIWDYFPEQKDVESVIHRNQLQKLRRCMNLDLRKDVYINCLHLVYFNKMYNIISGLETGYEITSKDSSDSIPQLLHFEELTESQPASTEISPSVSPRTPSKREVHLHALKKYLECDEVLDLCSLNEEQELFSHYYSEPLSTDLLLQALHKAFNEFTTCDFEYSRLTDCLLLWFHNDNDENGLYKEYSDGLLPTMVGFRDYYIYLSEKEKKWLKTEHEKMLKFEELNRLEYIKRNYSLSDPDTFSLAHDIQIPFPNKEFYTKNHKDEPHVKAYSSLGTCIIKTAEDVTKFHSADGAMLTVKKYKWIREEQSIIVTLNSHGNLINFQGDANEGGVDEVGQLILDTNEGQVDKDVYFHIETKNGIIISCLAKTITTEVIEKVSKVSDQTIENKKLNQFDVTISLPNGLMITFVRGVTDYIKQQYTCEASKVGTVINEDYRIFLSDGTVMVFMKNGSVIILYPNSTETRIKCFKKVYPHKSAGEESVQDIELHEFESQNRKVYFEVDRHEVISPYGDFTRYFENKEILNEHTYKLRAAMNYLRGLYTIRSDGTKSFVGVNGVLTTSFCDGTVITSSPYEGKPENKDGISCQELFVAGSFCIGVDEAVEEDFQIYETKFCMDHPLYMKVEYTSNKWSVHLPFDVKLTTSLNGFLEIEFDENTNLKACDDVITVRTKNLFDSNNESRTNFFLRSMEEFDNAICSIMDSSGKAFYLSKAGETTVFNRMNELTRKTNVFVGKAESSTSTIRKGLMTESTLDFGKRTLRKKSRSWVSLYYTKESMVQDLEVISDKPYGEVLNKTNPSLRPKQRNRYFILDRDLSGYEFISYKENENTLEKYKQEDDDDQPSWHRANITTNGFWTWSQRPIYTTWSKSLLTECSYKALHNTKIKKYELSPYLPQNKIWLCDIIKKPNKPPNEPNMVLPLYVEMKPSQNVFLIRRVFNNKQSTVPIPEIFEGAFKNYMARNEEILNKYKNHTIPDVRTSKEIQEAKDLFLKSTKYLFKEAYGSHLKNLTKGDKATSSESSQGTIIL